MGRTAPPQIGRGRRGCGHGGHHPPLRPGAAGWASGIPAGTPLPRGPLAFAILGASRPATSDISPLPGRPPSRGREPEAGPPPRWRRGPLGWKPRVSRSALSQATLRWPVRAPRRVRGPLRSHSRPTQAVSPSPSPQFSPAPRAVNAALRHRVLPTVNVASSSLPPELGGITRRGSPVRAWYECLPAFTPIPSRFFVAFPPTRFQELGVLRHGTAGQDPRRGNSEQRGSFTLPVTGLAIVRPRSCFPWSAGRPVSLRPLPPRDGLSTGLLRTRHRGMCSLCPAGGTCTPFPTLSP
jgi:hypothetical protein